MFSRINRKIKNLFSFGKKKNSSCSALKRLQSNAGQIAIILVIVTAISLVFYAVALNFSRLTAAKTITQIASNQGASLLASEMASYGQSLFQSQLGGQKKYCGWTGLLGAIIGAIVAIIAIVLAVITGAEVSAWLVVLVVLMAAANVALQAAYINPKITSMWNEYIQDMMETKDAFVEQAIQAGLMTSVTDTVMVDDVKDTDLDGLFGYDPVTQEPLDKISRFSYYYQERLKHIKGQNEAAKEAIEEFRENLEEFLYDNPYDRCDPSLPGYAACIANCESECLLDGLDAAACTERCAQDRDYWAIYDPWATACPAHECCYAVGDIDVPSVCNPCCIPDAVPNPWEDPAVPGDEMLEDLRPDCCDNGESNECGVSTTCADNSLYSPTYPWVYEKYYENYHNNFLSFREMLGRDDEHRDFIRDTDNINALNQLSAPGTNFIVNDTIGYQPSPTYLNILYSQLGQTFQISTSYFPLPAQQDERGGIFPYWYKIRDWGLNLSDKDRLFLDFLFWKDEYCHWYDERYPNPDCSGAEVIPEELNQTRLRLPRDPATPNPNNPGYSLRSGNPWVDDIYDDLLHFNNNPLAPDKIGLVDPNLDKGRNYFMAAEFECAQLAFDNLPVGYETAAVRGFWKKGGDIFCDDEWPYYGYCLKHGLGEGACEMDTGTEIIDYPCDCWNHPGGALASVLFPDDIVDDIVYGLPDFIEYAQAFLARDITRLVIEFENWYPDAAWWIEPPSPPAAIDDDDNPCYVCTEQGGALYIWLSEFEEIINRLTYFLGDDPAFGQQTWPGSNCYDVWCRPANPRACPLIGDEELEAMGGTDAATDEGATLDNIINCLNWNIEHPVLGIGNDQRFYQCWDSCNAGETSGVAADYIPAETACTNMPRSLTPGLLLPTNAYDPNTFVPPDADAIDRISQCPTICADCKDDCSDQCKTGFCDPAWDTCMHSTNLFDLGCDPVYDVCMGLFGENCDPQYKADLTACDNRGNNCRNICDDKGTCADGWTAQQQWRCPTTNSLLIGLGWPFPGVPASCNPVSRDCFSCGAGYVGFATVGDCTSCCTTIETDCEAQALADYNACKVPCDTALATCSAACDADQATCYGECEDPETSSNPLLELWMAVCLNNCNCGPARDYPPAYVAPTDPPPWGYLWWGPFWQGETINCFIYDAIDNAAFEQALDNAKGSCDSPDELDKIFDSYWEAEIQVAKFKKRVEFLETRREEMRLVRAIFQEGYDMFEDFLEKAKDLIRQRIAMGSSDDSGLPYQAVYGWRSDPPRGMTRGRWHIVRVDARSPGRCDNSCGTDESGIAFNGGAAAWPKVETYTESWGMKRCYELKNTSGGVKFRVIRWDEDISSDNLLAFPGGMPIWDFRYTHPDRKHKDAYDLGNPFSGAGQCGNNYAPNPNSMPPWWDDEDHIYAGAFILSAKDEPYPNEECWAQINEYLAKGVVNETCAIYYFHEGSQAGMGFSFVPCPALSFPPQGAN